MLLRIRFLPPGYANPGVVEVVLAQVGEARTVEVFWESPSIIMKANTVIRGPSGYIQPAVSSDGAVTLFHFALRLHASPFTTNDCRDHANEVVDSRLL